MQATSHFMLAMIDLYSRTDKKQFSTAYYSFVGMLCYVAKKHTKTKIQLYYEVFLQPIMKVYWALIINKTEMQNVGSN